LAALLNLAGKFSFIVISDNFYDYFTVRSTGVSSSISSENC